MLVLSRKKDEVIILKQPGQEDIRITVVRIDNRNKVRLGIEADKKVTVIRSELEISNNETCYPIGQISAETAQ
jgi:carbon storage regulator CsrA